MAMTESGKTWLYVVGMSAACLFLGYGMGNVHRASALEEYRAVVRAEVKAARDKAIVAASGQSAALGWVEVLTEDIERFADGSTDWKDIVSDLEATVSAIGTDIEDAESAQADLDKAMKSLRDAAEHEPGTPFEE